MIARFATARNATTRELIESPWFANLADLSDAIRESGVPIAYTYDAGCIDTPDTTPTDSGIRSPRSISIGG